MSKAIALREDYDAARMRSLARGRIRHAAQSWPLLALAAIYAGATHGDAARRITPSVMETLTKRIAPFLLLIVW